MARKRRWTDRKFYYACRDSFVLSALYVLVVKNAPTGWELAIAIAGLALNIAVPWIYYMWIERP